MVYEKLKKEIRKNGYTIKEFAEAIGMSDAGFHKAVREESFNMKYLKKMSEVLKKDFGFFFDEKVDYLLASDTKSKGDIALKDKVKSLEKIIEEKDRVIQNQNEYIDLLKKSKSQIKKLGNDNCSIVA